MTSIPNRLRCRGDAWTRARVYAESVVERTRFTMREARKRPGVGIYTLRHARSAHVLIRHAGLDAWTLHEVFGIRAYQIPLSVRQVPERHSTDGIRILDLGETWADSRSSFRSCSPIAAAGRFEPDPDSALVLGRCLTVNTPVAGCARMRLERGRDGRFPRRALGRIAPDHCDGCHDQGASTRCSRLPRAVRPRKDRCRRQRVGDPSR